MPHTHTDSNSGSDSDSGSLSHANSTLTFRKLHRFNQQHKPYFSFESIEKLDEFNALFDLIAQNYAQLNTLSQNVELTEVLLTLPTVAGGIYNIIQNGTRYTKRKNLNKVYDFFKKTLEDRLSEIPQTLFNADQIKLTKTAKAYAIKECLFVANMIITAKQGKTIFFDQTDIQTQVQVQAQAQVEFASESMSALQVKTSDETELDQNAFLKERMYAIYSSLLNSMAKNWKHLSNDLLEKKEVSKQDLIAFSDAMTTYNALRHFYHNDSSLAAQNNNSSSTSIKNILKRAFSSLCQWFTNLLKPTIIVSPSDSLYKKTGAEWLKTLQSSSEFIKPCDQEAYYNDIKKWYSKKAKVQLLLKPFFADTFLKTTNVFSSHDDQTRKQSKQYREILIENLENDLLLIEKTGISLYHESLLNQAHPQIAMTIHLGIYEAIGECIKEWQKSLDELSLQFEGELG